MIDFGTFMLGFVVGLSSALLCVAFLTRLLLSDDDEEDTPS